MSAPARRIEVSALEHGGALVEVAGGCRRLDHRVLAADVVGGERHRRVVLDAADQVEVGQRRLDHDDVGALLDVEPRLAHRLVAVGRVHLVAAAVAERGRRVGGLAERPVEGRGELRRVRHDRGVGEAFVVERGADRADAAVHHVARGDDVGAGAGLRDGRARQQLERRVVVDAPSARTTPQWPWLVYSHRHRSVITSRSGWASLIARVASWTMPSSSQAPEPSSSLAAGRPNSSTAGNPELATPRRPRRPRGRSTAGRRRASRRSARGGRSRARRTSGRRSQPARGCVSRTRPRSARVARKPAQAGLRKRHLPIENTAGLESRRALAGGPELDAPGRDQIRLDVGVGTGEAPRSNLGRRHGTRSPRPCGGSPSGPAITIRPASRSARIVRQVRVAVRRAPLDHVVDVVVEEDVGAIFVGHRPTP